MTPRDVVGTPGATLAAALVVAVAAAASGSSVRVAVRAECGHDCALVERLAIDVWNDLRPAGEPPVVVVRSRDLVRLTAAGTPWQVVVEDIDAVARQEAARLHAAPLVAANAQPADWYADYRDYRAITSRMADLAATAPELVTVHPIGSSLESRPLWALRIGGANATATPMLVNGTQHAREWISAMVTTCVAERLVRGYASDPAIRSFVDTTELWVVPVVNPDGYQYAWAGNRYWRKNRRGTHGVDLNRNWELGWGGTGSSGNRGSEVYRGEAPFSEPETAAVRDLVKRERIALHADVHSFGQVLFYPWGHRPGQAPDHARYGAIGDRMASAMFAAHQQRYTISRYVAAGTMTDWAYGIGKALSFTIELRPRSGGRTGFVLPPEQIKPTCDEGLAAILALRTAYEDTSR